MKGISLLEVLIYIGVASLVGIILVRIFVQNNAFFLRESAQVEQGLDTNQISSQIYDSIRNASSVAVSFVGGVTTYTSGPQTLVLTLPSVNASGSVIANTYDYLVITQDSQNAKLLRKKIFPDALSSRQSENRLLTTQLSSLTFSYYDQNSNIVSPQAASSVNFIAKVARTVNQETQESSVSGQVNLRND
ncbi:hypothetical protein HYS93_02275 [Candidatus Daviesbacteria bacterium]|nr:hypothetical protein [Candidatus Daviesbacteria bacterium]